MIIRTLSAAIAIVAFGVYITVNSSFALHLGKDRFYTYVSSYAQTASLTQNAYEYDVLAMNAEGKQRLFRLKVDQEIQPRSYLRLYINGKSEITDWEEIRRETLPSAIKDQI